MSPAPVATEVPRPLPSAVPRHELPMSDQNYFANLGKIEITPWQSTKDIHVPAVRAQKNHDDRHIITVNLATEAQGKNSAYSYAELVRLNKDGTDIDSNESTHLDPIENRIQIRDQYVVDSLELAAPGDTEAQEIIYEIFAEQASNAINTGEQTVNETITTSRIELYLKDLANRRFQAEEARMEVAKNSQDATPARQPWYKSILKK
jgi:hypothetical protein